MTDVDEHWHGSTDAVGFNSPSVKFCTFYFDTITGLLDILRDADVAMSCAPSSALLQRVAGLPPARCPITGVCVRTPLRPLAWAQRLSQANYPSLGGAILLVASITQGVDVGYRGPRDRVVIGPNLTTVALDINAVSTDIATEMEKGRRLGPFPTAPFAWMRSNPLRLVYKKGKSKPRLIHHLSWPRSGDNVNKFIEKLDVKLDAFDKAVLQLGDLGKGAFMSKIDIESAYRCIPVRPADWPLLGLQWQDQLYFDIVMQFGLASATAIFEWFSSAAEFIATKVLVIRALVHYVDDFMNMETTHGACQQQLDSLLALFAELGIPVSPKKIELPSQSMIFLGILFNSIDMTISLDESRVADIKAMLAEWTTRRSASKEELQSLIGVLAFASKVVRSSRVFLRRMIDQARTAQHAPAKTALSASFYKDVAWWQAFIEAHNGKRVLRSCERRAKTHVYTDACKTGHGALCQQAWYACTWTDTEEATARRLKRDSMPWKELYAIARAVATFSIKWQKCTVILHSDCEPAIKAWNKGDSRRPEMASLIRSILFMCAMNDIDLQVVFVAGVENVFADLLSRGQISRFLESHQQHDPSPTTCLPLPIHGW